MRPKRIITIRHGESEGNIDKSIYASKPDYALDLTPKGCTQASECGVALSARLGFGAPIWFYRSPFYRTRQTHQRIAEFFPGSKYYEDPRLREQEWTGKLAPRHGGDVEVERDEFGHFYYRFEGGESCADVYDRISDFLATLYRDFAKAEFPHNCAIISHGMTNRVFLMRLLHYTVEEFEFLRNPPNCGMFVLERPSLIRGLHRFSPGLDRFCSERKFRLLGKVAVYPQRNAKY